MATSAFKSTTRRTSIAGSSSFSTDDSTSSSKRSATAHRRSRSLSRFSRQLPAQDVFPEEAPRGKFVNTVRGSGFPEICLDDLAIELFDSSADRGRSASRTGEVRGRNDVRDRSSGGSAGGGGSVRRGRSVSRHGAKSNGGDSSNVGRVVQGGSGSNNSRRRRSLSVVPYQISDSESDRDHSILKNSVGRYGQTVLSQRPAVVNGRPALTRSLSQKDLKYNDGYSSQSSALTDDEGRDSSGSKNRKEKTIRAVYAQNKLDHPTGGDLNSVLYDVMRKELRHAVEEIKIELQQGMNKPKSNDSCLQSKVGAVQTASTVRKNLATKLEQSEKSKQELLAEIVLEQQHDWERSKIMQELHPDKKDSVVERPFHGRKRSNDRNRVSRRLTEEAEKYFEDFITNVEDTDISSLDGERSDTGSTLGGIANTEKFYSPAMSKPLPAQTDGVLLPWLQWETANDACRHSCKTKTYLDQATPKAKLLEGCQESTAQDLSYHSNSSRGSWSPGDFNVASSKNFRDDGSKRGETGSFLSRFMPNRTRFCPDVDGYLNLQKGEDFLHERWKQQQRISSGGLLLCNQMSFS